MSSSAQDWTAFSSLCFLAPAAVLAYKDFASYTLEITSFTLCTLASIFYHVCATSDRQWCPSDRDVQSSYDVIFAYLALISCLTPPIRVWLAKRHGATWSEVYAIGASALTFTLVTAYQDGLETALTLGLLHGCVLIYALVVHLREVPRPGVWWLVRLGGAIACGGVGVVLRFLSAHDYTSFTVDQSSQYLEFHNAWHILISVAGVLFFSILGDDHSASGYTKPATSKTTKTTTTASA